MSDCIKRTINFLKNKNFLSDEYQTKEVKEHEFIDSDVEFLKIKNDPASYISGIKPERIIYCKHCGKITHKDSLILSMEKSNKKKTKK